VSPEGRLRWHQTLGEAKHDASGALVKMVGIDLDITERKQAEEALRRSEELNRRTLQALPAHIAVLDRNGLILATNQAWAEFAAANSAAGDPSVTVGANYLQACRGAAAAEDESAKLALEGLESVIEGRRSSFSLEYPCLSPEGERWFIMNVAPLGADDGAVVTHLNITERRQAENALRESEERLRRVSDNADVGLIRCNRESIYLSANPAYAKIVGKPLEQIIGRPMSEVMGEQAAQSIRPYIERALRGERFSFEGEVPYVGAGKRYVQVSNAPDAGPAGEIASWVACIMDVTERKRAEIALRASERRFRVLFKSQLAFSTLLSPEGRLVDMSDACVGVAGATLEELVGLSFVEAPWWQDLPETRESWRRQIEEARTRPGPVLGEIEHRMNDGELRYALNSVTALRDEQGELEYFLCEGLDITERKRAEAALREADRRKDEFLATLAHELRNPLAPVRNGLEALRSLGVQDKSTDRPLAMMEGQVDHLIRLVDDLMDISRISRGKFELQKQRMDLAAAVSQAVNMSRHLIEAEGLDLKVDLPRSPTPVDGDAVRLTQVFANLLSNAAKHTKRGGRIEIALERVGDAAEARVVDTGAGIAEELLPLIFEPFVQGGGKSGGPEQGLGIGLALVRQIAEMHGGAIEARSGGEGFGSAFIVRLPLLGDEATETPVETSVPARLDSARRVLVIDDMPEVAEALAFLLDVLGATVRVAHCGEQSLELCAEFEPDLVLLDLSMPKMDGFETARRLKQLPAGRRAKLVAVTGFGERRSRARTQEAGFESHLVKPVRLQQLEELLASVGAGAARQTTAE
jgi:PAS domain S-box-containing protein